MKKMLMFVGLLTLLAGLTVQASIGTDDCPIKNLRKSQQRGTDGTAYYPKNYLQNHSRDVLKPNEVYKEN